MSKRLWPLVFGVFAFVLLSAGDCEISGLGDLLDKPGSIVVTNVGTEVAVVAIIADDVKSYPTIGGGATASAQTNVGGTYQVRVVMTPENTERYRQDLISLRGITEKLINGAATSEEKTQLFVKLAGIKAAIQALEQANAAGCSGNVKLNQDNTQTVNATVAWVSQSGAGFWDTTCGSN